MSFKTPAIFAIFGNITRQIQAISTGLITAVADKAFTSGANRTTHDRSEKYFIGR